MRSHHRCWLPPYSGPAEHSSPEECCDATVDTVPWPGPDGCDSLATVTRVKWESLYRIEGNGGKRELQSMALVRWYQKLEWHNRRPVSRVERKRKYKESETQVHFIKTSILPIQ